jgi:hypothetical protein
MTETYITQDEADFLLNMKKIKINDEDHHLPYLGGKIEIPLVSLDKRERFALDISRGRIDLKRQKYQNRAKENIVLVRLDTGAPHRNPDNEEIGVPHLHLYKAGYGDKWAYPIPPNVFKDINDFWQTLHDFMEYWLLLQEEAKTDMERYFLEFVSVERKII